VLKKWGIAHQLKYPFLGSSSAQGLSKIMKTCALERKNGGQLDIGAGYNLLSMLEVVRALMHRDFARLTSVSKDTELVQAEPDLS
jgi:hypothetical protein